jgi:hypothetical protein
LTERFSRSGHVSNNKRFKHESETSRQTWPTDSPLWKRQIVKEFSNPKSGKSSFCHGVQKEESKNDFNDVFHLFSKFSFVDRSDGVIVSGLLTQ